MSKVLSTRLDEDVIAELDRATRRLGITKKRFLEEAIRMRAEQSTVEEKLRIIREASGAWVREERPEETIRQIREQSKLAWIRNLREIDPERLVADRLD